MVWGRHESQQWVSRPDKRNVTCWRSLSVLFELWHQPGSQGLSLASGCGKVDLGTRLNVTSSDFKLNVGTDVDLFFYILRLTLKTRFITMVNSCPLWKSAFFLFLSSWQEKRVWSFPTWSYYRSQEFKPLSRPDASGRIHATFFSRPVVQSTLGDDFPPNQRRATSDLSTNSSHTQK